MKLSWTLLAISHGVTECYGKAQVEAQHPLAVHDLEGTTRLLGLHKGLVEHASLTGSEHDVARYLGHYLNTSGYTVEYQTVERDRLNVLAYLGAARETRILVTSHIDTVPPFIPYERRDDVIWGRGSADAKGSVAAQVEAVDQLRLEGAIDAGDVALLYVVGEEKGGAGMKAANNLGLKWESVVFGEPTELKLARGHKGGLGFRLVARGKAGHSGYPELGRNAIDLLVDGLATVKQLQLPWSEEFGNTTLNVGQIEGGVAPNVIPQNASATAAVRVAVSDVEGIRRLIVNAIKEVSPWLEVELSSYGIGPVRIDADIDGFETTVTNYGTDIPSLQGKHKRYLYGPGSILVAHSDHEHVSVSDLTAAVDGYRSIIRTLLSRNS